MTLEQQFRIVLLQLEMLSSGSTQAWNSSGSPGGEPDDRMVATVASLPRSLTDPEQPAHLRYRVLWDRCDTDPQREALIVQAMAEAAAFRVRGGEPVESQSDRDILTANILAAKGWTDAEVAQRWRCTVREVRRLRAANSLDDRGQEVVIVAKDVKERIRMYAAQGLSERMISRFVQVPPSTVRRVLGKAA